MNDERSRPGSPAGWGVLTAMLLGVATPSVVHAQKSPMAQAAYARAQQHLAGSRFREAAGEMETAVRYEPRFALGWYVLASAQRRAKRCDEAVFAYRRYMELRPADPDPYFGAGLCLELVGDTEAAAAALRHFVTSDRRPSSREFVKTAEQHLAALERTRDAPTKAAVSGPAAVSVTPSPALVEARRLRAQGRVDDAIARYREVVAGDPPSAQGSAELGAFLVEAGRPRDAVPVLRAAVKLAPASPAPWYHLAFALRESGAAAESVEAYRRYITLRPTDPDPHYGLARALVKLGKNHEALAAFRTYTILETRPTERRWVRKARLEIGRLEAATAAAAGSERTPTVGPASAVAPPPHHP